MNAPVANRLSAAGSALGYLAQMEYALLIALQRMDIEENLRLSLETADDITFETEGRPTELWQTTCRCDASASHLLSQFWKPLTMHQS